MSMYHLFSQPYSYFTQQSSFCECEIFPEKRQTWSCQYCLNRSFIQDQQRLIKRQNETSYLQTSTTQQQTFHQNEHMLRCQFENNHYYYLEKENQFKNTEQKISDYHDINNIRSSKSLSDFSIMTNDYPQFLGDFQGFIPKQQSISNDQVCNNSNIWVDSDKTRPPSILENFSCPSSQSIQLNAIRDHLTTAAEEIQTNKEIIRQQSALRTAGYKNIERSSNQVFVLQNQKNKIDKTIIQKQTSPFLIKQKQINKKVGDAIPLKHHSIQKSKITCKQLQNKLKSRFFSFHRIVHDQIYEIPIACIVNDSKLIIMSLNSQSSQNYLNLINSQNFKILERSQLSEQFKNRQLSFQRSYDTIRIHRLTNQLICLYELNGSCLEIISSETLEIMHRIPVFEVNRVESCKNGVNLIIASLNSMVTIVNLQNVKKGKPLITRQFKVIPLLEEQGYSFDTILRCEVLLVGNTIFWVASFSESFVICVIDCRYVGSIKTILHSKFADMKEGCSPNEYFISNIKLHNNKLYLEGRNHLWQRNVPIKKLDFSIFIFEFKEELKFVDIFKRTNLIRNSRCSQDIYFFNQDTNQIFGYLGISPSSEQKIKQGTLFWQLSIDVSHNQGKLLIPMLIERHKQGETDDTQVLTILDTSKALRYISFNLHSLQPI